jgi:sulfite exporter TauE/SafE/copper chaperone CopZ/plastocyanin domain-containing protein
MESRFSTKRIRIGGMTCISCQNKIEKKLRNTLGIQSVEVSYSTGTADITYDENLVSLQKINQVIEQLDYEVLTGHGLKSPNTNRTVGLVIIIAALFMVMQQFGILNLLVPSQLAKENMNLGMLFVIGLITSVHCIAMCGGINLSQCIPQGEKGVGEGRFAALRPTFLYNLGRVVSYTMVGFIVGGLGSLISFSNAMQGGLKLVAGLFMVIMGINMLGIFPWLRRFSPRMPKAIARRVNADKAKSNSPLVVGLLNGLMPCGPLQAMQIYALSSGSPVTGALSMFLFSLGTVPLMFGLGALSTILSKKFTQKVMTIGAVLVVVLGLSMFSQGWNLSGLKLPGSLPQGSTAQSGETAVKIEDGVQIVNSTLTSSRYPKITVQEGTPVKWVIDAPQGSINGCNNRMLIQEYGIEYEFKTGENVIEFTPTETGTIRYSCWMGMINGSITVVEAGAEVPQGSETGSATENGDTVDSSTLPKPVPAGVSIPTDKVAVAKKVTGDYGDMQRVDITLTDQGFRPAIIIVQSDLVAEWNIVNNASNAENGTAISIPSQNTQLNLSKGENPLYFLPLADFDFSTSDNQFYGYVKVVDSLDKIDVEAIKAEIAAFETLIYPPEFFQGSGDGASCH